MDDVALPPRGKERGGSFSREEKSILVLTSTCHFLSHMIILVFPAVTIPLMRSFDLPLEEVVKASFYMYLLYGLSAVPVGLIADRWQAKRILLLGLLAMGLGLVLSGAATSTGAMAASLAVVGIGASAYHPAGLALISHTVQRRGRALAINGVFGNLGIVAAPFATGLLTWTFSWRKAFFLIGGLSILSFFVLSFLRVNETLRRKEVTTTYGSEGYWKYFVILGLALVFGGICYRGNMVLLPAYLELKTSFFARLIALSPGIGLAGSKTLAATLLTSLVLLAGILGQLSGGVFADRCDLRRAYLIFHSAGVPLLAAMAWTGNYWLALSAAGYVFFSLGMQPIENSLIAAVTPGHRRSLSYSVKFILNFGIGASVVYIISPVKRAFSLETVYLFLAGIALLLVMSIVALIVASRKVAEIKN